jgi:uncharacterized protein YkwD
MATLREMSMTVIAVGVVAIAGGVTAQAAPTQRPPVRKLPTPSPVVRAPAPAVDAGAPSPAVDAGAPSPTVAVATLSSGHKDAVVSRLNSLRATLGAATMATLSWDDNLATFAEGVAKACTIAHSTTQQRTNVPGWIGKYIGENIAAASASGLTLGAVADGVKVQSWIDQGIGMWWAEKADYDLATNTCKAGAVCGHYTQLAWAATSKVGCAVSACTPQKHLNLAGFTLVCEFGVGGNVNGTKPYTPAAP